MPVLRSAAQAVILTAVLANPGREYTISELVKISASSQPTVSREVRRAKEAGLVATRTVGRSVVVRANTDSVFYAPMRQLLETAFGAPSVVAEEFSEVEALDELILFGSWVARFEGRPGPEPHDIDVLVIGTANRRELYAAADRAERRLGLPVQVTVRTGKEWEAAEDPFLAEVRSRPHLVLDSGQGVGPS